VAGSRRLADRAGARFRQPRSRSAGPRETLLAAGGFAGRDTLNVATGFNRRLGIAGAILKRMDGEGQRGAIARTD
jgi:signal recognition particle GTPase